MPRKSFHLTPVQSSCASATQTIAPRWRKPENLYATSPNSAPNTLRHQHFENHSAHTQKPQSASGLPRTYPEISPPDFSPYSLSRLHLSPIPLVGAMRSRCPSIVP